MDKPDISEIVEDSPRSMKDVLADISLTIRAHWAKLALGSLTTFLAYQIGFYDAPRNTFIYRSAPKLLNITKIPLIGEIHGIEFMYVEDIPVPDQKKKYNQMMITHGSHSLKFIDTVESSSEPPGRFLNVDRIEMLFDGILLTSYKRWEDTTDDAWAMFHEADRFYNEAKAAVSEDTSPQEYLATGREI